MVLDTTVKDHLFIHGEEKIEITSQTGDVWQVCILLPFRDTGKQEEMVQCLRSAKYKISQTFDVPYELLELCEVIKKIPVDNGIEATVTIVKQKREHGKPTVILRSVVTSSGCVFDDMIAELNISYLDESNRLVTIESIQNEIAKAGVAYEMCDCHLIEETIKKVNKNKSQIKGLRIANGIHPEEGVDARLEYAFHDEYSTGMDICDYVQGRKVREGDILCQKIPPRNGKTPGKDVRGGIIPPVKGLDFEMEVGGGTKLSEDSNAVISLIDGIVEMKRVTRLAHTVTGERTILEKVTVSVRPVIKVNADEINTLVTEDNVVIMGGLKKNSSIVSKGEVFVDGDIKEGANIVAGSLVMINGEIITGNISTDESVITSNGIKRSSIMAGENVEIQGIAENSQITGRNIKINRSEGSKVTALNKVTINSAGSDGEGNQTSIQIGYRDYYLRTQKKITKDLERLKRDLGKIIRVFGKDVIWDLTASNIQKTLIKYLRKISTKTKEEPDKKQLANLKALLEAVIPLKTIIVEKTAEIEVLKKKARESHSEESALIIHEGGTDPVEITIDGETMEYKES
ncbi:hypothetical protein CEE37_06250 [candidate division LCP-89 bacterium B3_LCP]|uniref:Flagellar Assembly Protein A N-terminal region domain-containing protein n=1 Tax=candidate division LCP-89 bacterium B3_LCP TaxID=2012998 RepID=A0A532V244_UNCL8|nr:MAG: hypothetical protein CEE37_06250 [candidate division LCP-89 bacterium B3_LCP]